MEGAAPVPKFAPTIGRGGCDPKGPDPGDLSERWQAGRQRAICSTSALIRNDLLFSISFQLVPEEGLTKVAMRWWSGFFAVSVLEDLGGIRLTWSLAGPLGRDFAKVHLPSFRSRKGLALVDERNVRFVR